MTGAEVHGLVVRVVDWDDDFAGLRAGWQQLYDKSPTATPYQSWAWLYSWWQSYGSGYDLRIVTLSDGKDLVGILPAMLDRSAVSRRLLLLGTGITDYLDVVARAGWESRVCEVLAAYLRTARIASVLDFQELRGSAALLELGRFWRGPRFVAAQSTTPGMRAEPWEEALTRLPRKRRETARKTMRRAAEDGLTWRRVDQEGLADATQRWLDLHVEYWRGRDMTLEHATDRFSAHLRAAAARLTESGTGALYECVRAGTGVVEAADLVLIGHDFTSGFVSGASQHLQRRVEVNTLLVNLWNGVALESAVTEVTMGRGAEPYKLKWCATAGTNSRLVLGRLGPRWLGWAGYLTLRGRAARSPRVRAVVAGLREPLARRRERRLSRSSS